MKYNEYLISDNESQEMIYLNDTEVILCGLMIAHEKGHLNQMLFKNGNQKNCYIYQNVKIENIRLYDNGIVITLFKQPEIIRSSDELLVYSELFIFNNELIHIIMQMNPKLNKDNIIDNEYRKEQYDKLGAEIKCLTLSENINHELAKYHLSKYWKKEKIVNAIVSRQLIQNDKIDYYLSKISQVLNLTKKRTLANS